MTAAPETTSEFYDRVWSSWGALDDASPAAYHRRRLIVKLVTEPAREARRVLDVGCGLGKLLRALALRAPGLELHGADISPASLVAAERACPTAELFLLDLQAPDFERCHAARFGAFDRVIASEVLEHIGDDARALARLKLLLAPGGQLIVTVPGGARTRFDLAIGHVRHYSRASLEARLRDAGYDVLRVTAWGFPFHTLYRGLVRVAARLSLDGSGAPSGAQRPLALGYRALGAVLTPLYYLNRPYWGEQLIAVARRPE